MLTYTIYHDPEQCIAHVIQAEVNEDNGAHVVKHSEIMYVHHIGTIIAHFKHMVGEANVHAYTIKEIV